MAHSSRRIWPTREPSTYSCQRPGVVHRTQSKPSQPRLSFFIITLRPTGNNTHPSLVQFPIFSQSNIPQDKKGIFRASLGKKRQTPIALETLGKGSGKTRRRVLDRRGFESVLQRKPKQANHSHASLGFALPTISRIASRSNPRTSYAPSIPTETSRRPRHETKEDIQDRGRSSCPKRRLSAIP